MEDSFYIQKVIQEADQQKLLSKGLNEVCRNIEQRKGVLCILAKNCDNEQYKLTVETLCKENGMPLIFVDDNETLGKWAGLCKLNAEGIPRKIVKCSCLLIKKWGIMNENVEKVKSMIENH